MGRTTQEADLTLALEALPADVTAVMERPAKVLDVLSRLPGGLIHKALVAGGRRQRAEAVEAATATATATSAATAAAVVVEAR